MRELSCVLSNLNNPLLNGISLGLSLDKENSYGLNLEMFPCCAGEGKSWSQSRDGVQRCALLHRIKRLKQLEIDFKKTWPASPRLPFQPAAAVDRHILQELAGVFNHDNAPAQISFSPQKAQATLLWNKALASTWRFGMETRIVNFEHLNGKDLSTFTRASSNTSAWFIERIHKLWDAAACEMIEYVVQQAYNQQTFLWLDFVYEGKAKGSDPPTEGMGNVRQNFQRRLEKLKDKFPLQYLNQDCKSRLESLVAKPLEALHGDNP